MRISPRGHPLEPAMLLREPVAGATGAGTLSALDAHRGLDPRPEEAPADPHEAVRHVRDEEARRAGAAASREIVPLEQRADFPRGLLGRVDETDAVAHHVGDDRLQQRVVRAAEDERVDPALAERREVGLDDAAGNRTLEPALLR